MANWPARIEVGNWDWEDILQIARVTRAHIVYRKSRCEHGKTRSEHCASCEYGYVYDLYPYALTGAIATDASGLPLVADSADGDYVVYIPMRDQHKLIAH